MSTKINIRKAWVRLRTKEVLFFAPFAIIAIFLFVGFKFVLINSIDVNSNMSERNDHHMSNHSIVNEAGETKSIQISNPIGITSDNLACKDWSKSLILSFSSKESTLKSKDVSHSKLARVLMSKAEYEIGDSLELLVRIDEPAGFRVNRSCFAELFSSSNVPGREGRALADGPLICSETPLSLYYKVNIKSRANDNLKPGLWRFRFGRGFYNVSPEMKTPNDHMQFEVFECDVKMIRKPKLKD